MKGKNRIESFTKLISPTFTPPHPRKTQKPPGFTPEKTKKKPEQF